MRPTPSESGPDKKVIPDLEPQRVEALSTADGVESSAEKIKESAHNLEVIESTENETDFFSRNRQMLGFKGKLDLSTRRALSALERDVSRQNNMAINLIREDFLERRRSGEYPFGEWPIRREYLVSDYRVFLILLLSLAKLRDRSSGRFM